MFTAYILDSELTRHLQIYNYVIKEIALMSFNQANSGSHRWLWNRPEFTTRSTLYDVYCKGNILTSLKLHVQDIY